MPDRDIQSLTSKFILQKYYYQLWDIQCHYKKYDLEVLVYTFDELERLFLDASISKLYIHQEQKEEEEEEEEEEEDNLVNYIKTERISSHLRPLSVYGVDSSLLVGLKEEKIVMLSSSSPHPHLSDLTIQSPTTSSSSSFNSTKFNHVCMGGTFDNLHIGHRVRNTK